MKWNQVKRQWPAVESEVKRTWGRIDEADLKMIHGERDAFARILAQRYGLQAADAEQKLDDFVDRFNPERQHHSGRAWLSQQMQKCWGHVHESFRH